MIDSIELAIFASFLRTTLPAKKHRESRTLKRYTDDQRKKISPFGNRLRPRLGCMHSSAECNNNVIQTLVKKKKFNLTTILTVFSHSLKKTVVFNNNNNHKTIIIIMIIIVSHQVALSLIY